MKSQINDGRRRELYHFRDQQGLEVDFIVPAPGGRLRLIECKAGATVFPSMAKALLSLRRSLGSQVASAFVVHGSSSTAAGTSAMAPGVEALTVQRLVALLRYNR